LNQAALVKQILALFPTASGILIFGSQTHAEPLSPLTDVDLLVTTPTAHLKHIHKIEFSGFIFDINLIPEINFADIILMESVSSFQSSLLDALITGKILFDREEILAGHKSLAEQLLHSNLPRIYPEQLFQAISTADKIAKDIYFKQKSLGQFLFVSLLLNKLIDIELMLNLGTQVISAKHKSALLKTVNPSLHKKLSAYAYKLDHPDYIKKISRLAARLLADYRNAVQGQNLYEQIYISGDRIVLDVMNAQHLFQFIHALSVYTSSHRLKGISYYYLLTPFKLGNDVSNKLVIKGKSLNTIASFVADHNRAHGIINPARHHLLAQLFGGEAMLNRIEALLTDICRLHMQEAFTGVDKLLLGIHFIIALGNTRLRHFSAYLFDTWLCLAFDTHFSTYTSLLQAKERVLKHFELLLQENNTISHFIKNTLSEPVKFKNPWQKELFTTMEKFARSPLFSHADVAISSFELKKTLHYTNDPLQGKKWFIYRKTLELLLLNASIDEKDFSFIAYLIKENY
jgi:hypothetical protein